jgi:hypothetical protein
MNTNMTTDNDHIEKELVNKIIQACDIGDIGQVKSLMANISLNSIYHQKNQTARKIFKQACSSGYLEIVDDLLYLATGNKNRKPMLNEAFKDLIVNNNPNCYPIISFLINTPKLEGDRNDDFYSNLEWGVEDAAKSDNLPLVKALMNLEDKTVDHNYIFSIQYMSILNNACHNNNIEVFKYIYDYRQSKDNLEPAYGLWKACVNKNINVLQFLIFEKNIEKNEEIEHYIELYDCPEAKIMFDARELNKELSSNTTITKKNKI